MSDKNKQYSPPVVSVLGHVDHGKTTLLDAIRKSDIASSEHGGITQRIGASTIEVMHDGQKRKITFIDTPGHEAFTKMRGRGSQVSDIGLLIVSSVDGVMPQTKESIQLLKKDKVPFIVVLTKSDSPEKNPEKVKQQLVREDVLLEGYGGDVSVIEVSARAGTNIQELLDLILLTFDLNNSSGKNLPSASDPLSGVIIESKLDPRSGPRATVVIKKGTISVKDEIVTKTTDGKVRSLINTSGETVQSASVGMAVEILGFVKVPNVGEEVFNKKDEVLNTRPEEAKGEDGFASPANKSISLILCADTFGSLEAIVHSMPQEVHLIAQKTGEISEGDILHAKSTGAIILTFNCKLKPNILKFAATEKILLKNYTIIYEMLDELQQVIEGKQLALMEQIFGVAKIQATFPFEKTIVLGISVVDGRVARGDKVRIVRGEETVGESIIVSLRQGKQTVSKAEKGAEAGIIISPQLDITIGDMIVCHS